MSSRHGRSVGKHSDMWPIPRVWTCHPLVRIQHRFVGMDQVSANYRASCGAVGDTFSNHLMHESQALKIR